MIPPGVKPSVQQKFYLVSRFVPSYFDGSQTPPLSQLENLEIQLAQTERGIEAPASGSSPFVFKLGKKFDKPLLFHSSAIRSISQAVVTHYIQQGLAGVYVCPSEQDINSRLEDLRPEDVTELRLTVYLSRVSEIRTLGMGSRLAPDKRTNNKVHNRILKNSPVKPTPTSGPANGADLLQKDLVEEYVHRLNRHPGRRVDTAVSSLGRPGEIALDYLVNEEKTWLAYAQAMNTGTKETGKWRQRYGFIENQLSNNDDILAVDYTTSCFDQANSVAVSYEAPVFDSQRLRWRVFGMFSNYTASEVGQSELEFEGEDYEFGGEIIYNIYQRKQFFVDAILGIRNRHVRVDNNTLELQGSSNFLLPYVTLRAERTRDRDNLWASVTLEGNIPDWAGTDSKEDLQYLGRLNVEDRWIVTKLDSGLSFYLEPLLNDLSGARNTPRFTTLAHEIVGLFRGQLVPDGDRLAPQFEEVAGGFYSVRGYPESVASGDSVMIGTAEYRYHIPRSLGITKTPQKLFNRPFQIRPQQEFGIPDWDLIARTFLDVGRTLNNDRVDTETNETLMSWGVGLEFQLKRYISIRLDWGMALMDMNDGQVEAGDNRLHVAFVFVY